MKKILVLSTLFFTFMVSAKNAPLQTVDSVDINRYLGTWKEIASFPNRFQKGCTATQATYSLRADGEIKVYNECRLNSPQGELQDITGRAWSTDQSTNAKLKVQFFLTKFKIPFLAGDYWILDLDEDYQYALVGEKSRKFLWILSRTETLDQNIYEELVKKAQDLKFDTSKLVKTIR